MAVSLSLAACARAENKKEMTEQESGQDSVLAGLQVREDILSAMEAAGRLSGRNFAVSANGEIYFGSGEKYANYAYAYYGMPISSVYSDDSGSYILAVMEDGSVYNGTTLLVGEDSIRDVAWKTHSTNIDAYMLTSDGNVYYYNPYGENDWSKASLQTYLNNVFKVNKPFSSSFLF